MNTLLEEKLFGRYPKIFKDMAFSVDCKNGWYRLLYDTCHKLEKVCTKYNIDITITCVKQKFGGIRIYYFENINKLNTMEKLKYWFVTKSMLKPFFVQPSEQLSDIIQHAQALSYTICEECGKQGYYTKGCSPITLCDNCRR